MAPWTVCCSAASSPPCGSQCPQACRERPQGATVQHKALNPPPVTTAPRPQPQVGSVAMGCGTRPYKSICPELHICWGFLAQCPVLMATALSGAHRRSLPSQGLRNPADAFHICLVWDAYTVERGKWDPRPRGLPGSQGESRGGFDICLGEGVALLFFFFFFFFPLRRGLSI
jgi:hypothetical protein